MTTTYEIHPRVGVARLGNSPKEFYLGPEIVGGLPIECDQNGNPKTKGDSPQFVQQFKDDLGRIKRQAQSFKIFKRTDETAEPELVTLSDKEVDKIEWTVHIANKKPIWYTFSELHGNLEFGPENSYRNQHVSLNNPSVTEESKRKAMMIDPGPRTIQKPGEMVDFSRDSVSPNYLYGSFPPRHGGGTPINTLGELRMDDNGNLIVLGGMGNVTGAGKIGSFVGASDHWDDISDGYVVATIHLNDSEKTKIEAEPAWIIVGSPKYAPELVNITTLYDTMYDVGIRKLSADKCIYDGDTYASQVSQFPLHQGYTPLKGFNPDYQVNYTKQIKPIIERMQSYRWIADIPYLADFASPGFDLSDNSEKNKENRRNYFSYFRVPVLPEDYKDWIHKVKNGPNTLFSSHGSPLMPLNSGDNSVTNTEPIYKFETLSATQYFFMNQWAEGKFEIGDDTSSVTSSVTDQIDEASVGNCVGAPFSPGIETTWIVRNAPIYAAPLQLKLAHFDGGIASMLEYYAHNGLSTTADEADGLGCQPGDMTKRMAIPWQSDFLYCSAQTPNITNPTVNQGTYGNPPIQVPPSYYVYWWPPQSPMHVVAGSTDANEQALDAITFNLGLAKNNVNLTNIVPAGQRIQYQRGIQSVTDMIRSWGLLGFIVNQGTDDYPYFVETERNYSTFSQTTIVAKNK
ncbi:MAG: CTQ-dependent lysine 6-oxidase LodA [Chloroflexota bacterium]